MISNRQNEITKVLTMTATVFLPISFIAGVYGMNFEYMPELHSPWGYPAVLAVMALTAGGFLWWFRRRGWLE
jgi:magnesium transporter